MDETIGRLTVYFEGPFWVGVFERVSGGKLSASRVTFGVEPKDYEVWEYILKNYYSLKFSPAVEAGVRQTADNPKRRQRNAKKLLQGTGTGTKSQQALQKQREEMKAERRQAGREQRESEKQRQFALKRQKQKEKHRGR